MTGHEDPIGHIEMDKDGKAFLKIDKAENEPDAINLDINRDGVVDEKDASLAGKVLGKIKKKKYK